MGNNHLHGVSWDVVSWAASLNQRLTAQGIDRRVSYLPSLATPTREDAGALSVVRGHQSGACSCLLCTPARPQLPARSESTVSPCDACMSQTTHRGASELFMQRGHVDYILSGLGTVVFVQVPNIMDA